MLTSRAFKWQMVPLKLSAQYEQLGHASPPQFGWYIAIEIETGTFGDDDAIDAAVVPGVCSYRGSVPRRPASRSSGFTRS